MQERFVTTTDNPYDYFDNFEQWNNFDVCQGYNTLSLLARLCDSSEELSEQEQLEDINKALESIVNLSITGKEDVFYVFVYKN